MQTTSPIRRYVIVRRRDHHATASRWSMERVAPTQRVTPPSPSPRPAKAA
ncbi:hypothetical protein [Conexibacter woesei]|nr:hypothetical protein [Conexibacter woesei]